jgi:hypothetical protein
LEDRETKMQLMEDGFAEREMKALAVYNSSGRVVTTVNQKEGKLPGAPAGCCKASPVRREVPKI